MNQSTTPSALAIADWRRFKKIHSINIRRHAYLALRRQAELQGRKMLDVLDDAMIYYAALQLRLALEAEGIAVRN